MARRQQGGDVEPYLQVLVIAAADDEERTKLLNEAVQKAMRDGVAERKVRTLHSVQFDSSIEDLSRSGTRMVMTVLLWFDQAG
jgi:hypothetical protein